MPTTTTPRLREPSDDDLLAFVLHGVPVRWLVSTAGRRRWWRALRRGDAHVTDGQDATRFDATRARILSDVGLRVSERATIARLLHACRLLLLLTTFDLAARLLLR